MSDALTFRKIDSDRDGELVTAYARDLFWCSFGDDGRFERKFGPDGDDYLMWLERNPTRAMLVYEGMIPIGMVALVTYEHNRAIGYVFHYYLAEHARNRSLADVLEEYACHTLAADGFLFARLSVSLSNTRAIRFYRRRGWYDAGPRPHHSEVHYFEKRLLGLRSQGSPSP